jgi:FkbM family methyltransferase
MIRIQTLCIALLAHICLSTITLAENKPFAQSVLRKGDRVFDVGAYVGAQTEYYLSLVQTDTPEGLVVAVEPQKIISGILYKRFGTNPHVAIVEKGVASQRGFLNLYVCHYFKALSSCSVNWLEKSRYGKKYHAAWPYATPIEVITLDDLIQEFGIPHLCKLDIENYEYEALCGLSTPIKHFIIEFHAETIEKLELCINRLQTLGNYQFNFSFGSSHIPILDQCVDAQNIMRTIHDRAQEQGISDTYCGELYASL